MKNFVSLLKYLDRNKITAEAVAEIASVLGYQVSSDDAAEIATAFKTRGIAGLLPYVPRLIKTSTVMADPRLKLVYRCKHCGSFGSIETTMDQLRASGSLLENQNG